MISENGLDELGIGVTASLLSYAIKRAVGAVTTGSESAGDINYPVHVSAGEDLEYTIEVSDSIALHELCSRQSANLLMEAYTLISLVSSHQKDINSETETAHLRSRFIELGTGTLKGSYSEMEVLGAVWDSLIKTIDQTIKPIDLAESLDANEVAKMLDLDAKRSGSRLTVASGPRYLRELIDLICDHERFSRAEILSQEVREGYSGSTESMRLDHVVDGIETGVRNSDTFESLYIERTLQTSKGERTHTDLILRQPRRIRMVVVGDPGMGKSTLTQHLVRTTARGSDGLTPFLVKVRDFKDEKPTLTKEIAAALQRDLQISDPPKGTIEDILTLGRAVVIFDAVDEAVSESSRIAVRDAIDVFAKRYPLATVVVTSRRVGYERASLSDDFTHYSLVELSSNEIREYATRWFRLNDATDVDADTFSEELESIPDLRTNPLMLSLICTLYRAKRYIPRNRRQVYEECADLLYLRWDSMRKIDQPSDQVQHGLDLMQDIALWFFRSPTARAGVEEEQLRRVVEDFFKDTAGVLAAEARHRAKSFVAYCMGRAWLLTLAGRNTRGQRVYAFSHQTFMEFFAAEALARTTSEIDELEQYVTGAYKKNPSSVVPELIVQSAEHKNRGRGAEIIARISANNRSINGMKDPRLIALKTRLAGALSLQPRLLDNILTEAVDAISIRNISAALDGDPREGRRDVFLELLSIGLDQRRRLVAGLLAESGAPELIAESAERQSWAGSLVERWCVDRLLERGGQVHRDWHPDIERLWSSGLSAEYRNQMHFARLFFGPNPREDVAATPFELKPLLRWGRRGETKGRFARALIAGLEGTASESEMHLLNGLPNVILPGKLSPDDVRDWYHLAQSLELPENETVDQSVAHGLLLVAMICTEGGDTSAKEAAVRLCSAISVAGQTTDSGTVTKRMTARRKLLAKVPSDLHPPWAAAWGMSRFHLVRSEDTHDLDESWPNYLYSDFPVPT